MDYVWIFNGGGQFPAGAFSTQGHAENWIAEHKLTGTLTRYPLDVGVYQWAIASGAFKIKRPDQELPRFIGRFSSAGLEHYHYEDGSRH
jgi:hypothetical protein